VLSGPDKDRKHVLNEMLRRGVTLKDLETLRRGEEVYLWERDVATLRVLYDFVDFKQKAEGRERHMTPLKLYRLCKKKESTLYKGKVQTSRHTKRLFGGLKFNVDYIVPIEEYPKFVQMRESKLDFVSKRTAYKILGRRPLNNMIDKGLIRVISVRVNGKELTGISKKSLVEQINNRIDELKRSLNELITYDPGAITDTTWRYRAHHVSK
jgi:hypothetical protein